MMMMMMMMMMMIIIIIIIFLNVVALPPDIRHHILDHINSVMLAKLPVPVATLSKA
jgi:hypothetical protein